MAKMKENINKRSCWGFTFWNGRFEMREWDACIISS